MPPWDGIVLSSRRLVGWAPHSPVRPSFEDPDRETEMSCKKPAELIMRRFISGMRRRLLGLLLAGSAFAFPGCSGCDQQTVVETDAVPVESTPQGNEPQQPNDPIAASEPLDSVEQPSVGQVSAAPKPAEGADDNAANSSGSRGSSRPAETAGSPGEALRRAQSLYASAQEEKAAGDFGAAFRDAAQAWALVNQFPNDQQCRSLAETILRELDGLARQANRQNAGADALTDKTLIEM